MILISNMCTFNLRINSSTFHSPCAGYRKQIKSIWRLPKDRDKTLILIFKIQGFPPFLQKMEKVTKFPHPIPGRLWFLRKNDQYRHLKRPRIILEIPSFPRARDLKTSARAIIHKIQLYTQIWRQLVSLDWQLQDLRLDLQN